MEIIANDKDWLPTDEAALAAFLETATGRRLIPALMANAPGLLPGGEINAILIRSGEVRACQTMIETLLLLAHPPVSASRDSQANYPALEDDEAWKDGQKLEVPKPPQPETPAQ
jgi:hypothetical protein